MSKRFYGVLVAFWLICVVITHSAYFNCAKQSADFGFSQLLPERFRSFLAACLWERADRLMHEGPVFEGQNFIPGSYAGNTDIVPLLKLVISLCPDQTASYRLLAANYAYHLGMSDEALALLDSAKINCADSRNCHEIYASEALIRLFLLRRKGNQDLKTIISLFDEAIEKYKYDEQFPDSVFTLENYLSVKSSLQLKLDSFDNEKESQKDFELDLIRKSPDDLLKTSLNREQDEYSDHEEHDNHDDHGEHGFNKENLLSILIKLVLKAGLVAGLSIILYRRG